MIARALPRLCAIALVLGGCTPRPTAGAPRVELTRGGKQLKLDDAATRALVQRVEKALAVCSFRSDEHSNVFGSADLTALPRC